MLPTVLPCPFILTVCHLPAHCLPLPHYRLAALSFTAEFAFGYCYNTSLVACRLVAGCYLAACCLPLPPCRLSQPFGDLPHYHLPPGSCRLASSSFAAYFALRIIVVTCLLLLATFLFAVNYLSRNHRLPPCLLPFCCIIGHEVFCTWYQIPLAACHLLLAVCYIAASLAAMLHFHLRRVLQLVTAFSCGLSSRRFPFPLAILTLIDYIFPLAILPIPLALTASRLSTIANQLPNSRMSHRRHRL